MARRPAFTGKVTVTGGAKVAAFIASARARAGEAHVAAGVVRPAQYADGTEVAHVAAVHEFGDPETGVAETAWMRNGTAEVLPEVARLWRRHGPAAADAVGSLAAGTYRRNIEEAGLVESGLLLGSIDHERISTADYADLVAEFDPDGS